MNTIASQYKHALPVQLELGNYRILRVLGQGGFGITYLAQEIDSGRQVVIKENLPAFCAYRDAASLKIAPTNPHDELAEYANYLRRFVEEAQLLARLSHPNIVKVLDAFEALDTAYYVMPWVGGKELHKAAPAPGIITEAWLLPILRSILGALEYLHSRNIYHRDVKPANILLTDDGTPILIDFGTARAIISERSATMIGSPGYSPIEQITANGKRGPWTDVYSLGATCYRLITGKRPPEATERLAEDDDPLRHLQNRAELRSRFSSAFLSSIDKALGLRAKNRWQTATEWMNALPDVSEEETSTEPISRSFETSPIKITSLKSPSPDKSNKAKQQTVAARSRKKAAFILLGLLIVLGTAGGYMYMLHWQEMQKETALQWARGNSQESMSVEEAVQWLRKAAEQGDAAAQFYLGVCYETGSGVEKNEQEAVKWYRLAADQGYDAAQSNLGVCYYVGNGVEKNEQEAVKWYRLAADQGFAKAQNYLGFCYQNGNGVEKNEQEAVKWYRLAADQRYADAQSNLGDCYQNGIGVEKNEQEAVKWYRLAADQGFADAQFYLGVCYYSGSGVEKNEQEAVKWVRLAADQGDAKAQFTLGFCYDDGIGVEKNEQEAVKWYRLAADQGFAAAQNNLGFCYENGIGVEKNEQEAVKWYRLAADQGFAAAQYKLGVCYQTGIGVEKNEQEAVKWYRLAADQGYAAAQSNLGVCYDDGIGVEKNFSEAVRWYRLAADQRYADAQFNLGVCYEIGFGVEKNEQEAVKWYRLAADQGHAVAQYNLGVCYKNGIGVKKNISEAVRWYRQAAQQGYPDAQEVLRKLGKSW